MEKIEEKDVLIIVPTYNEEGNILSLLDGIFKSLPDCNVLFVDDNSPDDTRGEIAKYQNRVAEGQIHLIERAGKLGLGTAYVAGFKWALDRQYQYIVEMDADLSHDPAVLVKMKELFASNDVVIGSRYVDGGGTENWGLARRLISRCGSIYARFVLGLSVRDLTGGFNAWSRKVLTSIGPDNIRSEGYAFQIELKYRALINGFSVIETPIMFKDRVTGISKMSGSIVYEAVWQVFLLRRLRSGQRILSSSQRIHSV